MSGEPSLTADATLVSRPAGSGSPFSLLGQLYWLREAGSLWPTSLLLRPSPLPCSVQPRRHAAAEAVRRAGVESWTSEQLAATLLSIAVRSQQGDGESEGIQVLKMAKEADGIFSSGLLPLMWWLAGVLGTVVSYNLLRREGHLRDWKVPLYLTVGSPLALTAIRKALKSFAPTRCPECVNTWFNAMDERDVVALYPLNPRHFPLAPAEPEIQNKTDVRNRTENRHGIAGYLDDQEVAK